jgi:uncharacterized protein YyaL (SSP411 family)
MNTNGLINENSPYLLRHAHNPVNWHAWNDAAFYKAKHENKPVFLSIGYSACHWCRVMERESFEDAEVAAILNRSFVSIKVDREERPDIDSVYMEFCQKTTGSGGWPLTIIMTPDCKPFFAGTYLPKSSAFKRPGLIELLTAVEKDWAKDSEIFAVCAENILGKISGSEKRASVTDPIKETYEYLCRAFDAEYGGFGVAPKFPSPSNLMFLTEYYKKTGDAHALHMLNKTLTSMYKGGIFDHIGYGFSRYSTDDMWLAPHFEKMLYDNALLIGVYSCAYGVTKNNLYKEIADKCFIYVTRELMNPEGGFFSSQDADSDGEEGAYYLLGCDEILNVLGKKDGSAFINAYGITRSGNFNGKNIPNLIYGKTAAENGGLLINNDNTKLYAYRKKRRPLITDDKIIASWNCLITAAFADAYRAAPDEKYLTAAKKTYGFIANRLTDGKNVYATYRNGKRSPSGFLDDYAAFIYAGIALYRATLDSSYLDKAENFLGETVKEFFDEENGGFYMNKKSENNLIRRPKEFYDGAIPSGNSLMYYNLFYLSELGRLDSSLEEVFVKLKNYLDSASAPGNQTFYACAATIRENASKLVVVLKDSDDFEKLDVYKPEILNFDTVSVVYPGSEYNLKNDRLTFFVCKNKTCFPPSNDL